MYIRNIISIIECALHLCRRPDVPVEAGRCAIPADLNARPARPVSALPSTGDVIRAIEDLAGQGADTV
jgi:hypothetical protein